MTQNLCQSQYVAQYLAGHAAKYMSLAIQEARRAYGKTSPNPAVGAVLVWKNKVIATGFHRQAGLPHAEVDLLTKIVGATHRGCPDSGRHGGITNQGNHGGLPLQDAVLYVTLEPCHHFGKTPPCTAAIIRSGIKNVVVGMKDPDARVAGRGIKALRQAGIRVRVGVLKKECEELNRSYIHHRLTGRPWVILKMALSLDGKIGSQLGPRVVLSGKESLRHVHEMRNVVDAILVGRETVQRDNPRLTTRILGRAGRVSHPLRVILDSHLKSPLSSFVYQNPENTLVATTLSRNNRRVRAFQKQKIPLLFTRSDSHGRVCLEDLLDQLGKRNVLSVLVEGGAQVATSFLKEGWVNQAFFCIAPVVLGGNAVPFGHEFKSFPLIAKNGQMIGHDLWVEMKPK